MAPGVTLARLLDSVGWSLISFSFFWEHIVPGKLMVWLSDTQI